MTKVPLVVCLSRETLSILIGLLENGVNPEALAAVVKELRREAAALREAEREAASIQH
jgi:mitotic-spindle organizing protein 1